MGALLGGKKRAHNEDYGTSFVTRERRAVEAAYSPPPPGAGGSPCPGETCERVRLPGPTKKAPRRLGEGLERGAILGAPGLGGKEGAPLDNKRDRRRIVPPPRPAQRLVTQAAYRPPPT